ncbi:MAG: type II secretion system F family protein [Candidatus Altiarchaeota archaeon]
MNVFNPIVKVLPRGTRIKYRQLLRFSRIQTPPDTFMGSMLLLGLFFGFIMGSLIEAYDLINIWGPINLLIGILVFFVLFEGLIYMLVLLSADSKAREVETALPDALQLMSSNIRAGLTTDKALLLAARPEFGYFSLEIKRIGKEAMAGRSLTEALQKTGKNVRSTNLERTMDLIIQSINSGGKLADLLDQTADDLRDQQMIQKEISASVLMYVFFIFIAIGIGAPALYAMSSFLVNLMGGMMNTIAADMPAGGEGSGAMPISITKMQITPEFIRLYSIGSLIASSFFGAMVMGLIMKGEERDGFKFFPILVIIALSLFFLGGFILDYFLGGMMQY